MSQQLINLSPDLKRLRDEGFQIEIFASYLVLRNVPYVSHNKEIKYGDLISELTLAGNAAVKPSTHVIHFSGEMPCDKNGRPLSKILNSSQDKQLAKDLFSKHMFSSKPKNGYKNFYDKMSTYALILSNQAQAIDPAVSAKNFTIVQAQDDDSVFHYLDTASSRAEIMELAQKFENQKVGIVGLGGTGSYLLDLVSKTPVEEIHIFDSKPFLQHNAFRFPGAPSIAELEKQQPKVEYLSNLYGRMHKGIVPHNESIDAGNVDILAGFNFVFLCLDSGSAKPAIMRKLSESDVPFIDVGMGIYYENGHLGGQLRVTTGTKMKNDHLKHRISTSHATANDNDYSTNIQIADLNALNATLAVLKWKKLLGFYWDSGNEYCSFFKIGGNKMINEDYI